MNIPIKYNLFTFSLNDGWREKYSRRKYNPKNRNERLFAKKLNVKEKKYISLRETTCNNKYRKYQAYACRAKAPKKNT